MKKLYILIFVTTIIAFSVFSGNVSNNHSTSSILEANLLAALELDSKVIVTCGNPAFDFHGQSKAPLLEGMGDHTFLIATQNQEVQTYFNQGLNLVYAFNHTEAHRSFKEVTNLSDQTAMGYWGQAYALGPNINDNNIDQQRCKEGYKAVTSATDRLDQASALEKSLINSLIVRFQKINEDSIVVDNEAYMEAMAQVAKKYPENADVLTLYAAAIMNTMPWNYWDQDHSPRKNTLKAKTALEQAIKINSRHPGAHHYYIHLTELPLPELAAASGDALGNLMPGAGHIVHMPSHAYIRVGRYKDAAEANIKAIEADENYIAQCYAQGIYPLLYYPHNIHFLWSAATLMGDSKVALLAARKTAEKISPGTLKSFHSTQQFAAVPLQTYVRFGKWNEILTVPYPGDNIRHLKLMWHYARGMAFIRKNNLGEAREELDSLNTIKDDPSYDQIYATLNHSGLIADIAYSVVAAEFYAAKKAHDKADRHFNDAIAYEDQLTYSEPPSWHLPVRQNYGAFLIDQKRYPDAEKIYNEDMNEFRNNGWSLIGLYKAHLGQGKMSAANASKMMFNKSWEYADIEIDRSVF